MGEPVFLFGKSFIDTVVKVFIVREDDMTADVVQLRSVLASVVLTRVREAYEAFRRNVC